jgi:PTH1 family peptidyl-tRNA hydrolase
MKLIVGLGNPGRDYESTRHNLGFMLIDKLFELSGGHRYRDEAQSKVARVEFAGHRLMLVKPQTYMNLSGDAVAPLLERHGGGDPANLVVAVDDVALPLGMIRIRARGSAGGQKGLKSIIERLGTAEFARIRLGIKPEHQIGNLAGFVLSPVGKSELEAVREMIDRAAEAVRVLITDGVERSMAMFNQRVKEDPSPVKQE